MTSATRPSAARASPGRPATARVWARPPYRWALPAEARVPAIKVASAARSRMAGTGRCAYRPFVTSRPRTHVRASMSPEASANWRAVRHQRSERRGSPASAHATAEIAASWPPARARPRCRAPSVPSRRTCSTERSAVRSRSSRSIGVT